MTWSITWALRLLAASILFTLGSLGALADHMTGQYSGTGEAAGTTLELQQNGWSIQGQLSGMTQGTLSGQSDGGDTATGTVNIVGVGQLQFQAQWSQAGLTVYLFDPASGGQEEHFFTRIGGPPAPHTHPTPQPGANPGTFPSPNAPGGAPFPAPNAPGAPTSPPPLPAPDQGPDYYISQDGYQSGPLSRFEIEQALAGGDIAPGDLAWKEGMAEWAPVGGLPEFAAIAPAGPQGNGPPPLPDPSTPPPPPGDANTPAGKQK